MGWWQAMCNLCAASGTGTVLNMNKVRCGVGTQRRPHSFGILSRVLLGHAGSYQRVGAAAA
eukprot:1151494-Pelagomonas_calceolata.AAC.1